MLNQSDQDVLNRAEDAGLAQLLRGPASFGGVAFREGVALSADAVVFEAGYADCLPVLGGACWRDPASIDLTEASL